ncbi:DUF6088 family protein [Chitinophaga eiseniae]|uniref:S-adenosylhomocysteine hydrolase n=1 Tax=Chitinophaga eiseniae TaxID=634771 RepID=A0A847SIB4_9BACT|nr:DUF6088 family protein [Chitinophaga eiseniae]NLR79884.1 hypothetical protein [Chitinophaga eiseniae]
MKKKRTLENKMSERIRRTKSTVLLRQDFADLGDYDQVGRGLKSLTEKQKLVKISQGIYAKTRKSLATGKIIPVEPLPDLAKKALNRLGVKTTDTKAEIAYRQGRSTQIPTGRQIGVNKRVTRKIGLNEAYINFEYAR